MCVTEELERLHRRASHLEGRIAASLRSIEQNATTDSFYDREARRILLRDLRRCLAETQETVELTVRRLERGDE